MTRDPRRPEASIDDAAIEDLVREVAAGWTMPPVRLDAPSWRDRIRSPRARRIESGRAWLGRAGRAATAAVALTVVAAVAAVLIQTRPPAVPGKSGDPSSPPTPGTSAPAFTPLPKLLLDGDLPSPTRVVVQNDRGDFTLVDLETGVAAGNLTGAAYGSAVQERADGTLLCLCVKTSDFVNGQPTQAEVSIDRFGRGGELTGTTAITSLSGEPDPRDGAIPERPAHVTFWASFSEGGRYGFVGWSARAHPVWRSGIIVMDLAEGREVSRLDLPDASTGEGDTRRVVFGPSIVGAATGDALVLARESYSWSPPGSLGENFDQEAEVFRAEFGTGAFSNLAPGDASGCGERILRAGAAAGDRWWIACQRYSTSDVVVRRFDATGTRLGDTPVAAGFGVDGDMTAPSPDGGSLYVWNPTGAVLTRVDLATGEKAEGRGPTARAEAGPLLALGRWLAPPVMAKTFLDGGVVVSPDGTRVYAAGLDPDAAADDLAGSAGIFVFDAASLESLDRWAPTADFVSIAISADGRYVYAAGMPGFDADGTRRPAMSASITVFATSDGSVRLIAGQLGGSLMTFVRPILD